MARVAIAYCPEAIRTKDYDAGFEVSILSTAKTVENALLESGHVVGHTIFRKDIRRFVKSVRDFKAECIFNLCETISGDSGLEKNAVAVYEILGVPYTGNGFLALGICQNKEMTKNLLKVHGIRTPEFVAIDEGEPVECPFPFPAIVKPLFEDGSSGITSRSVVNSTDAFEKRVAHVLKVYKQPALVEEFIDGREMQVSVLGNGSPQVLAVAELSYEGLPKHLPKICSYSAKWEEGSTYYKYTNPVIPADIDDEVRRKLNDISIDIFLKFEMQGYARVDFRMKGDEPYVIEVNPNPDISVDAGFERAARHAGMNYAQTIDKIVSCALE